MPNHYNYGLKEAKREFFKDLQKDKDFEIFKQNSKQEDGFSYGTVIVGFSDPRGYILNVYGPTSRKIISSFLNSLKK